ncbi:MAG: hypothetical protein KC912_06330 [Proteobacteria bacterium]|nr:hypothetical protein [Pseudomonadota bacterium]
MLTLLLLFGAAEAAPKLTLSGGMRTTVSAFSEGRLDRVGLGVGGQSRIQIGDRVGTEWFLDYISTDLEGGAHRVDDHIGWSVMFYPLPTDGFTKPVLPYVLAGHCFDYTVISIPGAGHIHPGETSPAEATRASRLSSAVQFGVGTHFNLTERFDISPTAQYMIHLGNDLHYDPKGHGHAEQSRAGALEGHLLFNVSVNYRFKMPGVRS